MHSPYGRNHLDSRRPTAKTPAVDVPDTATGIPVVTARGTPRAMGEMLGRALRDHLSTLTALVADRLRTITPQGNGLDRERLAAILQPAVLDLTRFNPSLWMELEGMSLGSGLPIEALLLIHGYSDLLSFLGSRMPPAPSTWLGIGAGHAQSRHPLQALAWSPEPMFLQHLVLVRRAPSNGPRSLMLTVAGLHPVIGLSEARIAAACNELRVHDGAPGLFTCHLLAGLFHLPDFDSGVRRLESTPRFGGGAVHVLAGDGRRASLETSGRCTARLGDPDPGMPRVHTNHPIADEILPCVSLVDDSSRERLGRIARRAVADHGITPAAITEWFGLDNSGAGDDDSDLLPQGIPDAGVVAIADPLAGRMWIRTGDSGGSLAEVPL